MTYSYYSNYSNNNQNKTYGYGNNTAPKQETGGGWSKGTAKGLDTLQSGGWGKKTQPTGVFSTSAFGTGSSFGANKIFGANKTFGSGGSIGSKGFGTGYGLNKPAAKRNPVPISTLGLRFTSMKKEERNNANQRKEYTVYHINMIEMFSQYTSDELRIYDYVSRDQIKPIDDSTQPTSQSKTTGFSSGSSITAKKEEKVINHNVQWYQVFIDKWPEIKGPDKAVQNKKQYLDLPPPKFEVAADKKKEEEELIPNTRVKLKGFKTSSTTFQNHLENLGSEQDLILIDPLLKEEDFKFRLQFSLTPTTQRTSTIQNQNTRRGTSGTSRGLSRTISENADQDDGKSNSSGLTFIPDINDKTDVSNLNILKDGVKLIFPSKVDVTKLDPDNNVKIELDTKKQTNKEKDQNGKEKTFVSTISIIKISIDEKGIKKEKKDEQQIGDDGIDVSTPSIIFYSIKDSNHYFVRTANKNRDKKRVGSIVNEYISDLNSYPVEIYYEKERKLTDSNNN